MNGFIIYHDTTTITSDPRFINREIKGDQCEIQIHERENPRNGSCINSDKILLKNKRQNTNVVHTEKLLERWKIRRV
jgi:hypothetical protein